MAIKLTQAQTNSEEGQTLRDYLWWVAQDGYVSDDEIRHMKGWLDSCAAVTKIPAFHYLRELVDGVLADNVITEPERNEIHRAIIRTLPKGYKEPAEDVRKQLQATANAKDALERVRLSNLATESQKSYILSLGGNVSPEMTKVEASALIDKLTTRTATVRQQMVLRFWDKSELSDRSVEEVSEWMDALYEEEPLCLDAWEIWKAESGENGSRDAAAIKRVPVGAGIKYLKKARIVQSRELKVAKRAGAKTGCGIISFVLLLAAILVIFILLFR